MLTNGQLTIEGNTSEGNTSQIPATVEQTSQNKIKNQNLSLLSSNSTRRQSPINEQEETFEGLTVIPDELANAPSNRDDSILIAITRSLRTFLDI